jgi:hypothetical protein
VAYEKIFIAILGLGFGISVGLRLMGFTGILGALASTIIGR